MVAQGEELQSAVARVLVFGVTDRRSEVGGRTRARGQTGPAEPTSGVELEDEYREDGELGGSRSANW